MNNFINSSLKGNILVVDDTPANLNLLKRILSEQGYKVRCARNGQLALKAAQFSPPDLILLDILMPEMDGYQICSQLKADERTKDVPIIFISALHETFEKVKAFEAGGVDYITKPFQVKEVLARVENHLRLSQLSKQLLEQNARLVQEIEERKKAEEALRQSEERYGAIVEAQTEAIARFNPEGKLTFVNEAYCRYFGLSQYELIGNHFQSLVFSEDLAKIEQLLNSLSWDNPVREIEHRLVVRGEVRWMQWSIQAIFDRAGSLLEFQSVGRDISDRKKTEEHLQLLERAIAASNNGIMICDALVPERPIIYTNSGFERITGYKKEEVLGKNCRFLQGNDKNQPALKELRHAIAKARETQVILRNYRKDGTLFWNQFCLTPVRDDTGRLTHFIGVQTDITKRQQQEEALRLIVEGTAAATGEEFFRCCTRYLAQVLKVRYAFVTQLVKGSTSRVRTLAFWTGSDFGENIESELPGTPCQQVILGATAYYPQDVQETFPEAQHLVEFGVQSYLGIPLIDAAGNIMGHLAVMDISPLENDPDKELILRIFAARAGAELERQRAEEEIRFLLSATSAIAQADDFNCALSLMLHSCCEFIGWDLAEAWIPNGDGSLLEYFSGGLTSDLNDSSWCAYDPSLQGFRLQSFKITFVPGVGLPGRIWSSQQPEWIEDVSIQSSLLFKRHEIAVLMGLKACFGIPILLNNRVLAVLVFFKKAAIPAQPHLVELVQGVVAQAALLIQRKRTEEKLRTSEAKFREKATELEVTVEKLKRTQTHVIQAEKMSGLGKMVAGVAHEINNPVGFIVGNIALARQYFHDLLNLIALYQQTYPTPTPTIQQLRAEIDLEFLAKDWQKLINSIQVGAERIQQIVGSLRNFSRLDESELKPVDIHEGIDSTLFLLQHRLRAIGDRPEIEVIKNYAQLPKITCYASQLNQVFMHLLNNAIDAVENQPIPRVINICTTVETGEWRGKEELPQFSIPQFALVRIGDNGQGISEEVRSQIFDPFFTTKPVGSGMGLGLSLSYQIVVEKHGGELQCISALGKGTEFVIKLPLIPGQML